MMIMILNLYFCTKNEIYHTARKNILKLVKLPSLVAKYSKILKIEKLAKFTNQFAYFCITQGKTLSYWPKFTGVVRLSVRNKTEIYKICKLLKSIFSVFYDISLPYLPV